MRIEVGIGLTVCGYMEITAALWLHGAYYTVVA
jgi:hypothetical protein